ncbi:MAG: LysR family transcriptional regulator [Hyphomonadaceae bacterium]|nr:LysR family transcriptional regulator [Hyphomonadaceae bacterium]
MPKSKHREKRPSARLDWDDIRIFAAVAAAGSVNKAAVELKVQPSSVSRRIGDLEKRMEAKLLLRTRTGVSLTAAGEDLLDRAQSMQRIADDIERAVRARDKRDEGGVTIAAPDGVGALWLAPRIPDFLDRYPQIQLALNCIQDGAAPDLVRRPDISISVDKSLADIGDDASELATMHYVFAASPAYLKAHGTPNSLASAAVDHRALKHTGQVMQRDNRTSRAYAAAALASFSLESNSSSAVVAALRAGAGIATVPTYLLTLAPELVVIGGEQSVPIKLWLIVHKQSRHAARVARAADWLRSVFDGKTNPWFRAEYVPPDEFET